MADRNKNDDNGDLVDYTEVDENGVERSYQVTAEERDARQAAANDRYQQRAAEASAKQAQPANKAASKSTKE